MQTYSTLDEFKVIKTMGSGYSGKVKLGQNLTTGQNYALKILKPDTHSLKDLLASLKHEYMILKELTHSSIVKMYDLREGVYTSKKTGAQKSLIYAIIELATAGEIFDFIFHTKGLDEDIARYYFKSLVESMSYLHQKGVGHRDLKPENLLLDSELKLKLIDFGFATVLDPKKLNKTSLGTEKYMAPEILYKKAYDAKKADVFAAGVILFVMFSGHPPFNKATQNCPYYTNFVKDNKKFWEFHSKQNKKRNYSQSFKNLVNSMIALNQAERPSFEQIMSSEWVSQPIDNDSVHERMVFYKKDMDSEKEIKKQQDALQNRDDTEISIFDQLDGVELHDLKFEKDQVGKQNHEVKKGLIFKTENKEVLAKMVLKFAADLNGKRVENKKDKVILSFEKDEGIVELEVKFYEVSESEIEIQFLKKTGDYFDFQQFKSSLQEKLLEVCYE